MHCGSSCREGEWPSIFWNLSSFAGPDLWRRSYAPKVPLTLPRLAQWPYIPMHRPRRSCTAGSAQSNSLRHPGRLPQLAVRPLSGNTRLSLTAHHGATTKWAPVRILNHPSWNGCHQTSCYPWQLLHLEFHIIYVQLFEGSDNAIPYYCLQVYS